MIVIENKIDSRERSDQPARYRDIVQRRCPRWRFLGLCLMPVGEEPSLPTYIPASYSLVGETVEVLADDDAIGLVPDVRIALAYYAEMLRRHIVGDSAAMQWDHRQ